ncbi:MAG: hypothetical protein ABR999_09200 [Methanoregula sp.]|uniref:hypothetical protein n=1 Tax=Methanoregula sp. TaxID=2052170 RepID=UPI003D139486
MSEVDDEGIDTIDLDYGPVFNYSTGSILGIYGELDDGNPEWYPDAGNYCGYILHGTGAQRVNNNKLSPTVYSIG